MPRHVCCIVNCKSRSFLDPNIKYYRFPVKDPWDEIRRKQWIAAVSQFTADADKLWEPSYDTKICSLHFEGGSKSDDIRLPSYIPTLFPSPCILEQKDGQKRFRKDVKNIKNATTAQIPSPIMAYHCCVVDCRSRRFCIPNLTYYKFPRNHPREEVRRKQWIAAVAPFTANGKLWEPTKYERLCSLHFEGEKKTEDPQLPSYLPTIFPSPENQLELVKTACTSKTKVRKRKDANSVSKSNQSDRKIVKKHKDNEQNEIIKTYCRKGLNNRNKDKTDTLNTAHVNNCYTVPVEFKTEPENYCTEASMQTFISSQQTPRQDSTANTGVFDLQLVKREDNKGNRNTIGFVGYSEELEEFDMAHLSGVNHTVFHILLEYITQEDIDQTNCYNALCAENMLLMFLMKVKLDLPFSTLGFLFKISANTASEIFCKLLDILYENAKMWIKWPSRNEVPFVFTNYPECRAMIDFIEISTDTPQDLLYKSYKLKYTIKYLIATNPSGAIIFLSNKFIGRGGIIDAMALSNFMDLLEAGDKVMANKDFSRVRPKFLKRKYELITPSSAASSDPLFTAPEMFKGGVNIIETIQELYIFKIMDNVDTELVDKINQIVYVLCAITNIKESMKIVKTECIDETVIKNETMDFLQTESIDETGIKNETMDFLQTESIADETVIKNETMVFLQTESIDGTVIKNETMDFLQ